LLWFNFKCLVAGFVASGGLTPVTAGSRVANVVGALGSVVSSVGLAVALAHMNAKLDTICNTLRCVEQHLVNENQAKLQMCSSVFDRSNRLAVALLAEFVSITHCVDSNYLQRKLELREELKSLGQRIEHFEPTIELSLQFNKLQTGSSLYAIINRNFTEESFDTFKKTLPLYLHASVINARLASLRLFISKLASSSLAVQNNALELFNAARKELEHTRMLMASFMDKFDHGEGTKNSFFLSKFTRSALEELKLNKVLDCILAKGPAWLHNLDPSKRKFIAEISEWVKDVFTRVEDYDRGLDQLHSFYTQFLTAPLKSIPGNAPIKAKTPIAVIRRTEDDDIEAALVDSDELFGPSMAKACVEYYSIPPTPSETSWPMFFSKKAKL